MTTSQLQRLAPDPVTAPHVRWIFAERGAGRSAASIARELNERGVPCPSSNDPTRNRHRSNTVWSLRTIIEIVENPRYTGRQVWGRTSADRRHRSVTGRRPSTRRDMGEWAISTTLARRRQNKQPHEVRLIGSDRTRGAIMCPRGDLNPHAR
ncbi:recombinase family protein [Actinokineospora sp.]|uniref:recombinase family protein n=1 Tax=Actinokineospora sp. TaxID=1872133 RepID=UPI003D6BCC4E